MSAVSEADVAEMLDGADTRRHRLVKAIVIDVPELEAADAGGASKSLPEKDVFEHVAGRLVPPPFDLLLLSRLPEHSSELGQVIEAMETNICGFGYRFAPRINDPELEKALAGELRAERVRLTNFFAHAAEGESFTSLRRRTRKDVEGSGNGYWEVIRNRRGEIIRFKYLPAHQMRLGFEDSEFTEVDTPRVMMRDDGGYAIDRAPELRRFRRYVQGQFAYSEGSPTPRLRWFKQFGDPRVVDVLSGDYVPPERVADFDGKGNPMPEGRRANEVIHWRIHCARSPYGLPRYMGNMLAILGARQAEEVNLITLRNNNIPSMALLVSNGRLTSATVTRIKEFIEKKVKGNQNWSTVLIIEGESELEGEEAGQVKIDMKPLAESQHTDAMFSNYRAENIESIRRAFRMPPIFIGSTKDYNRATVEASRQLADEQVFAPERAEEDWTINDVLAHMGIVYHRFQSRTPNVTDNRELVSMLTAAERTGAITPRIARAIVEDVFPQASELPDSKVDPDTPYSMQLAEAMKSQANPTEPNQLGAPVLPAEKAEDGDAEDVEKRVDDYGHRDGVDALLESLHVADVATTYLRRLANSHVKAGA